MRLGSKVILQNATLSQEEDTKPFSSACAQAGAAEHRHRRRKRILTRQASAAVQWLGLDSNSVRTKHGGRLTFSRGDLEARVNKSAQRDCAVTSVKDRTDGAGSQDGHPFAGPHGGAAAGVHADAERLAHGALLVAHVVRQREAEVRRVVHVLRLGWRADIRGVSPGREPMMTFPKTRLRPARCTAVVHDRIDMLRETFGAS